MAGAWDLMLSVCELRQLFIHEMSDNFVSQLVRIFFSYSHVSLLNSQWLLWWYLQGYVLLSTLVTNL